MAVRRTSVTLATTLVLGTAASIGAPVGAHAGETVAVRYASPHGSGTACSVAAPCGIIQAVNNAPGPGEVIVEPGTYGAPTPLTDTIEDLHGVMNIHGEVGKPMPVIESSATTGLEMDNDGSLRDLAIVSSGIVAFQTETPNADHLVGIDTADNSYGCAPDEALTDSLCVASGAGSQALHFAVSGVGTFSSTIRGVTAIATGAGSYGLGVTSSGGETTSVTVENSILKGAGKDVLAKAIGSSSVATASIHHSDYATTVVQPGKGSAAVVGDATDIHALPVFAGSGDFNEKAASPTINRGAAEPPSDTTDLAGNPRTVGSAPDMGAYEFLQPPVVKDLKVAHASKHTARLTMKVNPERLATKVRLSATHTGKTLTSKWVSAGAGHKPKRIKLVLHGLAHHATYKVHAIAKSVGGTSTSKAAHAHPTKK